MLIETFLITNFIYKFDSANTYFQGYFRVKVEIYQEMWEKNTYPAWTQH